MWGDIERSPALAAPSFNKCIGTTSSTLNIDGEDGEKTQAANDLCERYRPLAFNIARGYRNRGIPLDDLRSAALTGLVIASRKFDPTRGAFGPCARPWIRGEITRLFKPTADAFGCNRASASLDSSFVSQDGEMLCLHERIADDRMPVPGADLSTTTDVENRVLVGRFQKDETLEEIGREIGVSPERVRQIEKRAIKRVAARPGNVARACIRDLLKRRGYKKPKHHLLPFKKVTYPCQVYSREEIVALVALRPDLGEPLRYEGRP
jgi:RNA polymerase sigma factor (sigma-70 family)